ncbi:anamorsin homolog [Ostrea edulis]|uniref:anamorsin homolog n=1 Tax=Ostrea edulis TaxID=37623 RepID=UPI0024AF63B2|nr:anamorsin homolog [Ostrea edulis]XP_048755157.2 anamorsin homolog [Ostrea edulis]
MHSVDTLGVSAGQRVLLLWSGNQAVEKLQQNVELLTRKVGETGKVQVENIERLTLSSYADSSFDVAISGFIQPCSYLHTTDALGEICRILKPSGHLAVIEPVNESSESGAIKGKDKLISTVKLSGFVDISQPEKIQLSAEEISSIQNSLSLTKEFQVVMVTSKKPNYEVGSTSQLKLSFGKKKDKPQEDVAKVWTLSVWDMLDEDVELVDDDALLDADDLKKPDPSSLRATCGDGPKKKKACKNCTCGLSDELEAEAKTKKKTATSACGSCYLGDAFRCASCPYLGMPAFKPGEKVVLSGTQLKADA